eukprot:gene5338-7407_t
MFYYSSLVPISVLFVFCLSLGNIIGAKVEFVRNEKGENLYNAIKKGNLAEVQKLIEEDGTLVNYQDKGGSSPLHKAASKGHNDVVSSLIKASAYINLKDAKNETALDIAKKRRYDEIVSLLQETQIKANETVQVTIDLNFKTEILNNTWNRIRNIPTLYQILLLLFVVVVCLVSQIIGASLLKVEFVRNEKGEDLNNAVKKGNLVEVQRLIEEDGTLVNYQDKGGSSALHKAASKGHNDVVLSLLEADADIQLKDYKNETALDIAKKRRYDEIVSLLQETQIKANETVQVTIDLTFKTEKLNDTWNRICNIPTLYQILLLLFVVIVCLVSQIINGDNFNNNNGNDNVDNIVEELNYNNDSDDNDNSDNLDEYNYDLNRKNNSNRSIEHDLINDIEHDHEDKSNSNGQPHVRSIEWNEISLHRSFLKPKMALGPNSPK